MPRPKTFTPPPAGGIPPAAAPAPTWPLDLKLWMETPAGGTTTFQMTLERPLTLLGRLRVAWRILRGRYGIVTTFSIAIDEARQ